MVMAAARSVLRASGSRIVSPGEVLERVNDLLCPDIPERMFVTCLYAVLDPATGPLPLRERWAQPAVRAHGRRFRRAAREGHAARPAARHDVRGEGGDARARATRSSSTPTASPKRTTALARCTTRRGSQSRSSASDDELIDGVLTSLARFTGEGWEQEDDITIVTLRRTGLVRPDEVADLHETFSHRRAGRATSARR